ncbi:uncharacterized protein LOC144770438 isoform X3 [Lissotriton helveticus]
MPVRQYSRALSLGMANEIKESLRILSPGVANGIKDGDESESLLRGQCEALKEEILKTLQENPDGITLQKLSQVVLESEQFRILQPLSDYRAIKTDSKLILNLLFEMRNLVFEIKNATEASLFRCRLRSDEPPRIPHLLLVSEKSGLNAINKMILTTLRKHQSGIHVRQLIKDINQTYGIDLKEYSRDKGFKEVVEFLEKVPRSVLLGSRKSKQCSIHPLPIPGLMAIAGVVHSELRNCGGRMKALMLIKIMQDKYQVNMEKLCQDYFFENALDILKQVPNIAISKSQASEKSIIKLLSGAAQSVCELIIASLRKFKSGVRICTLTTHFKLKYALDLKKYSKDLGYRNTVDMFKLIPGIALLNPEKQTRCFIKLLPDVTNERQRLAHHSLCTAVSPKSTPPNNSMPPNTSVSLNSNEGTEFGSPNLDENGSYGTDENGCQSADENWSQRFYESGSQGTTTNQYRKINCPLIVRLELCKLLSSYLGTLWYRTMKLRTLKTKMRLEHGINLDEISRNLGHKNCWNFLQQARNIGATNPEDPTRCLLYMRKGYHVELGCSGLCQDMPLCRRRRTLNPQKIKKVSKNRIPNYPVSMCHQKAKTIRTGFRNRRSKFLESGFVKPSPVHRKVRRHLCFTEAQPKDTKQPLSKPKPSVPVPPGSKNTRKKKKKRHPKRENTDESHDLKLCQKISISSIHQPALMYHDEPQKKLFPVKNMKSNAPPSSRILGKGGPSKIDQEKMLMTPAATEPLNPSEWLFSKNNSMGNINRRGQQLSRETASKTTNHLHQMESERSAEHCNSSLPRQHQVLPTTSLVKLPKPVGTNHSSYDPFPSISTCRQTSDVCRDPILKEEILGMLLLRPQGITFGEFAGVFRQTHGYKLRLAKYGYSSLRSLLDDMKDLVMVVGDPRNPLILPRSH